MLSYNDAFYELRNRLKLVYDGQEAAAIAHELMEHITGLNKLQRLGEKDQRFTNEQQQAFEGMSARLLLQEPLQYVTGTAWFMGREFKVNRGVLIPRPETEELVDWIIKDNQERKNISILDIGTGSGCIPISLKLYIPDAEITSCDISEAALYTARENTILHDVKMQLLHLDFLETGNWHQLPQYDIIVSNPPYIPVSEQSTMDANVKDFEPGTALFVPDEDAQLFYRNIALFGKKHLKHGGAVYCELHKDHAVATKELFEQHGYNSVILKKDMHGNNRMLKAVAD